MTFVPGLTLTGIDSPVTMAQSTDDDPSTQTPSIGT